ncbi:hypothetical protein WJX72_002451 [[Myrmecia] bisecta]|uniref:RRM domain-containing protein n=1 Tax=[Myrmecia] bisecta TaxID=41462 RepID=A0AAW1R5U4_9CHLO
MVGGPGFAGGAACAPVNFYITAKDSRGARIKEGGAYVVVKVAPGPSATAAGAQLIDVAVKDNNDGTYTGTYTVPARGDYQLSIEVNGSPIGGSPFPVFFSPPEAPSDASAAPAGDAAAGTAAAGSSAGGAAALGLNAEQLAQITAKAQALMPVVSLLGTAAHNAGVVFPTDEEVLARTLLIGNISPTVTLDQLKQLFSFCGTVTDVTFLINNQYAFVEFSTAAEATAALPMNNMMVADRALKVEAAKVARDATPQGAANPFTAMQVQQLQQYQIAQMSTSSLTAQVAQLRAMARINPGSVVTGVPQNSASQRAAALSAAAALSKRLAALGGDKPRDTHIPVHVKHDRSGKRRRSVSPTIRYRKDVRRERSRERSQARSRPRSRDRELDSRSRGVDLERSRGRSDRGRDRDRERDGGTRRRNDSRERRHRRAARTRSRSASRDPRHRPSEKSRSTREPSRDKERERGRSKEQGKARDSSRGHGRDDNKARHESRSERRRSPRQQALDADNTSQQPAEHAKAASEGPTSMEVDAAAGGGLHADKPASPSSAEREKQRELEASLRRQLEERHGQRRDEGKGREEDPAHADGNGGSVENGSADPGAAENGAAANGGHDDKAGEPQKERRRHKDRSSRDGKKHKNRHHRERSAEAE